MKQTITVNGREVEMTVRSVSVEDFARLCPSSGNCQNCGAEYLGEPDYCDACIADAKAKLDAWNASASPVREERGTA